jgi:hypothetical protein
MLRVEHVRDGTSSVISDMMPSEPKP